MSTFNISLFALRGFSNCFNCSTLQQAPAEISVSAFPHRSPPREFPPFAAWGGLQTTPESRLRKAFHNCSSFWISQSFRLTSTFVNQRLFNHVFHHSYSIQPLFKEVDSRHTRLLLTNMARRRWAFLIRTCFWYFLLYLQIRKNAVYPMPTCV